MITAIVGVSNLRSLYVTVVPPRRRRSGIFSSSSNGMFYYYVVVALCRCCRVFLGQVLLQLQLPRSFLAQTLYWYYVLLLRARNNFRGRAPCCLIGRGFDGLVPVNNSRNYHCLRERED
jgi:hypothetical protein